MTKNNQKVILILILVLLIFTSIIAFAINLTIKDDNNPNVSNESIINKEITRLNNSQKYFAVQKTINDIFSYINDTSTFLTFFDNEYINSNNLTEDNILDYFQISKKDSINFVVEEIYFNDNSNITYYFIKCYTMEYEVGEDNVTYHPNKYYLLIVDNNNHYVLKPLENITNLEEYAKTYDIKEVKINNNTKLKKYDLSDDNRVINYINNYSNLINLDITKAYEMLDDETKKQYYNLNSFVNDIDNIYANLFTTFKATSKKENGDNTIYKVQNRNMDTITITEYYPNDYKIGFSFLERE